MVFIRSFLFFTYTYSFYLPDEYAFFTLIAWGRNLVVVFRLTRWLSIAARSFILNLFELGAQW